MKGHTVQIINSQLSCVPVGTIGTVTDNHPLMKGVFVEVDTIHTALFGGGTQKGHGKYFFEYSEVKPHVNGAKVTRPEASGSVVAVQPLVNESK